MWKQAYFCMYIICVDYEKGILDLIDLIYVMGFDFLELKQKSLVAVISCMLLSIVIQTVLKIM